MSDPFYWSIVVDFWPRPVDVGGRKNIINIDAIEVVPWHIGAKLTPPLTNGSSVFSAIGSLPACRQYGEVRVGGTGIWDRNGARAWAIFKGSELHEMGDHGHIIHYLLPHLKPCP